MCGTSPHRVNGAAKESPWKIFVTGVDQPGRFNLLVNYAECGSRVEFNRQFLNIRAERERTKGILISSILAGFRGEIKCYVAMLGGIFGVVVIQVLRDGVWLQ